MNARPINDRPMNDRIVFEDVSKFYGEILGVNRINLSIPPGITSLVGPNGSGKTTLMNLMTGLAGFRYWITGQTIPKTSSGFWAIPRSSMPFPKVLQDFNSCIPISGWREGIREAPSSWRGARLSA